MITQSMVAARYKVARLMFETQYPASALMWQDLARKGFDEMNLGKKIVQPKVAEADVWTPLPHNNKVEVNQHGIYRTVDMSLPVVAPSPVQPDEYYGYEGWGLFPDGE